MPQLDTDRGDPFRDNPIFRYRGAMTQAHDSDKNTSGSESGNATTPETTEAVRPERRGPPPNPLHHPLFLPILLIGFLLWFGYDGFLTADPDMAKHQNFNRIMFGIMLPFCLWMVPRGIKEFREDQAQAKQAQTSGDSD